MSWKLRRAKTHPLDPKEKDILKIYLLVGAIICLFGHVIVKLIPIFAVIYFINWIAFPIAILVYLINKFFL